MGSNPDKAAHLSPDEPPPKTSFFSRLASPLRSRTRNLADFHVRLQEPHRQYSAGDHVKGHVVLSVVKPFRITHLTVSLHGYVRVYKNAAAGAQLGSVNPSLISHDGNRNFRYHGNGHASLFQDEQVLCGEGRLKPARFEFEFDLIFPSKGLPSSIDFERGTISYMVTATLTRPTSIAPTSSCDTKVGLVEKVDIGLLVPPRERKVTMQTMRRKPRRKKNTASPLAPSIKRPIPTETLEPASDRDSIRANETSNGSSVNLGETSSTGLGGVVAARSPLQSDLQSEISGDSVVSNNSGSINGRGADASGESVAGSRVSGADDREITATVELLKGGCLPGEQLPVKIRVEHNRRLKSMHGIIVTLYRQGRVDYAPPLSLFTNISKEDAKRLEREEYYPRSRTGLGGLSLSSAGSCSVFRKDLSQAVAPLIIDPTTLTANITTSVRVPEDVFPSIKSVPGGLISFKYHVEVVVDLGGKLAGPSAGPSQQPTRMGSVSIPGGNNGSVGNTYGVDLTRLASWNGAIVDTDHLRREKGVISVSFEVVVGTMDSNRTRGKAVTQPTLTVQPTSQEVPIEEDETAYGWNNDYHDGNEYGGDYGSGQFQQSPQSYFPPATSPQTSYYDFQQHGAQAPVYIPPPEVPRDSDLTEKERVRQAEQKLLPSQPPQHPSESEAGPSQPSAPSILPGVQGDSLAEVDIRAAEESIEDPSAPTLADLAPATASNSHTDDKQELERRRLMEEASAPPDVPEDYDDAEPSAPALDVAGPSTTGSHEPSAPVLDEEDNGYGTHDSYHTIAGPSAPSSHSVEPLPKYER
ncbi:arrestin [Biscogniauxia sp. FL1348]|nr:arrestin [Biscogniauxia sp. FL1348]